MLPDPTWLWFTNFDPTVFFFSRYRRGEVDNRLIPEIAIAPRVNAPTPINMDKVRGE